MQFDELPTQRETESRSLGLPVRLADLAKLLEHGLLVLGSNPEWRRTVRRA